MFRHFLEDKVRMADSKKLNILEQAILFRDWKRSQLSGLVKYVSIRTPIHGDYVYREGKKNYDFFIIARGEFEITTKVPMKNHRVDSYKHYMVKKSPRKEMTLLRLKKGGFFGVEEGFDVDVKSFSVKAATNNCKLFLIPKNVKNI